MPRRWILSGGAWHLPHDRFCTTYEYACGRKISIASSTCEVDGVPAAGAVCPACYRSTLTQNAVDRISLGLEVALLELPGLDEDVATIRLLIGATR